MRIALVAGEASGDILGAGLIRALKERWPHAQFEGVGGPLMQAEGLHSLYPMERLSVMGLVEVLGRLRELLRMRSTLAARWLQAPPDLFVGIDAPDFNLGLEARLRKGGILTAHYVSPSVWAWREGRVKTIAKATDLMLCLLPFEVDFYTRHQIRAEFIGHTLADEIPLAPNPLQARQRLGLNADQRYVALLPGSRGGEVARLAPLFLDTAERLAEQLPGLAFVIPAANAHRRQQLESMLVGRDLPLHLLDGQSREAMLASDAVLLASGTAALEGMLLKKPMVVAYRFNALSWAIISRMVKVKYVALPNLLADAPLVPELLQHDATPSKLADALLSQLNSTVDGRGRSEQFHQLHLQLRCNASERAADALASLLADKGAC